MFNTKIVVERLNSEALRREVWEFMLFDRTASRLKLRVEQYRIEVRSTRRQKWQREEYYDALKRRESSIAAEEVPLPDDVRAEAMQKLIALIDVDV